MEKPCSKCKVPFVRTSADTYCKPCRSEYSRQWTQTHREQHAERTRKNRMKYKAEGPVTKLTEKACGKCEQTFPLTEEFWNRDKGSSTGFNPLCRECSKQRQNAWIADNIEKKRAYTKQSREKTKEAIKQRYDDLKYATLLYYSNSEVPSCVCCGEKEIVFLCIDHIDGGGNQHRKSESIKNMLWWIKKNNYPPLFQTLCANCNIAKHILAKCPHGKE